jgi:hypothetical protein
MKVVIKKGEKWLLKKLIEIRNNYQERNEVVRLENERIIFENVSGMIHGLLTDSTKDSTNPKNPSYTSSDYSSLELYFTENSSQSLDNGHKAKEQARWLMMHAG